MLERYNVMDMSEDGASRPVKHPCGVWVRYDDAQQTVERLERENKRLFDDWKACRDALKGNINDPDPLPCTDERSLTLYGMVAGVLRSRDDLKQQVAQLREDVSKIECELSEWKLASAANETGHLFRCARVNGKWSCAKGCHAAAHTTLQGLVEQANYELAALFPVPDRPTFENAFTVCGNKNTADARCILNAYEAIHEAATLPREGVTSHGGEHE